MFQARRYLVSSNQGYLGQDGIWLLFGLFRRSPVTDREKVKGFIRPGFPVGNAGGSLPRISCAAPIWLPSRESFSTAWGRWRDLPVVVGFCGPDGPAPGA